MERSRIIADHLGVNDRMVIYIHAELLSSSASGKISQKSDFDKLQRTAREHDDYKAQMEAAQEAKRQIEARGGQAQCVVVRYCWSPCQKPKTGKPSVLKTKTVQF